MRRVAHPPGLAHLFQTLLASFRIAVAVVCVGLSLILGAQWFGLIPDAAAMTLRARGSQCEAIAINSAAMVRLQKWHELEAILSAIVARDEDLLSAGIRMDTGQLRVKTVDHESYWPAGAEAESGWETQAAADFPEVDPVQVPIRLYRQPWGRLELCYRPLASRSNLLQQPIAKLLGFFGIGGLCFYTVLAARMMGLLNGTQVVPDRVRNALDTLSEGLLVLDEHEQIVLANQAFSETVAIDAQQLTGRKATELGWLAESDEAAPDYPWTRDIAQREPLSDQKLKYQLPDGRQRIFSINSTPLSATSGGRRGMLATFRDITHVEEHRAELEAMLTMLKSSRDEISRKNRALEILATQDPLTSCLNRRAFFERFDQIWETARTQNLPLSCIMIDNDHFKSVNDTYGHHIGDEVLRQVSATLRKRHQAPDLVCRFGGEEFCILLPGRDVQQAQEAAELVRQAIEALRFESPSELRTTASIGVAEISQGATTPQEMINQADACLYVAKRQGRNQVVVYQPGFEHAAAAADPLPRTREESQAADATGELQLSTAAALLTALAHRDADTAEHCRRVAALCTQCAAGLLTPGESEVLGLAALLHDIGKIGVPDRVLLKPGPLEPDEWKLMELHDRIGADIVTEAFTNDDLLGIIRTHHAFFDGTARTPELPAGEDIPLGARILTVCDSYDAMINDRPYRQGRSHAEAIAELRRCAGTQFDPQIVEHFIQAVEPEAPSPFLTLLSTATELVELCQPNRKAALQP